LDIRSCYGRGSRRFVLAIWEAQLVAKCPRCFAVIPGFSRSCVKCGLFLGNRYQWVCPKCGNAVRRQDSYCSRCGYSGEQNEPESVPEQEVSEVANETDGGGDKELDWRLVPTQVEPKGVLTWRDAVKIGCGIAMAPYIFAVISFIIYVVVAVLLVVLEAFYQDGLGFLLGQVQQFLELIEQATED